MIALVECNFHVIENVLYSLGVRFCSSGYKQIL